jgi:outer membrane protein TolC
MAVNELELNRSSRREALGAFLPSLDLSARTGLSFDRQLISTDFFGNPIENPVTEWLTNSSSSQYAGANIVLFQGGRRFKELSAQSASARVREATVSIQLRTVRGDVVRAYSQAQLRQALLRVEESLLEARQADLEMTRRMFDLAGATRVEVLAAELGVQRQEQQIQQRGGLLQQALLALARIIGDPDLGAFRLSSEAPAPFDPALLDEGELIQWALDSNPIIQQRIAELARGRAQVGVASGSRWPTLTLNFDFNQRVFAQEREALFDLFPDQGRFGSAGVSLSIPLFSRFQTSARIAEAQVAADNAEENLRKTRLQVVEETRSRLIALETAYKSYLIALRSQEIAQERLSLARDQFRQGSRSFTELQRDIDDSAIAEREVITHLFAWVEALANLEETVGELRVGGGA